MSKIFIANWKMQLSFSESKKLAKSFTNIHLSKNKKVIICPDFISLSSVADLLKNSELSVGAQDLAAFEPGAYTGEVSAKSLSELGVKYVLVGHSERRAHFQEGDKLLSAKLKMAISQNIIPILCVGENTTDRRQGRANSVIRRQLKGALNLLSTKELKSIILAYEPVWAIGTGIHCDLESALSVKNSITEYYLKIGVKKPKILYGGSINADSAQIFIKNKNFDGLLVGGASLDLKSFKEIVNS